MNAMPLMEILKLPYPAYQLGTAINKKIYKGMK